MGKKINPLNFTVLLLTLVAKFGYNFLSSKLYMFETQDKKRTSLKFTIEPPLLDDSATTGPGGQILN